MKSLFHSQILFQRINTNKIQKSASPLRQILILIILGLIHRFTINCFDTYLCRLTKHRDLYSKFRSLHVGNFSNQIGKLTFGNLNRRSNGKIVFWVFDYFFFYIINVSIIQRITQTSYSRRFDNSK